MGIMDNEGHDPMGFGNVRSALPMQADPDPHAALIEARSEIKRLRAREKLLVDVVEEAGGLIETIINDGVHYNWHRTAAAIRRLNESTGEQAANTEKPHGS